MPDLPDGASEYLSQAYAHRLKKLKPKQTDHDDDAERIAREQIPGSTSGQGGSLAGGEGGPESTGQQAPEPPTPADESPVEGAVERERVLLAVLDDENASEDDLADAFADFLAAARAEAAQKARDAEAAKERAAAHETEARADAERLSAAIRRGHRDEDEADRKKREDEAIKDVADRSWNAYSDATYKRRPRNAERE